MTLSYINQPIHILNKFRILTWKLLKGPLWIYFLLFFSPFNSFSQDVNDLPNVLADSGVNLVVYSLRQEAARKFLKDSLPHDIKKWNDYKAVLKKEIIHKTGVIVHQDLPLNIKETGSMQRNGYSVKNIFFQTRPGVYATANLFIPEGNGKFPGVIVMMGHSAEGRLFDKYLAVGITLALNGYVALCIDPWGAGERTTIHGVFEDHGDQNNLGSALLNIGTPLMGLQITDNIRGVDLLCSLPYVDRRRIGATGSSGGGNQTMWLTAMDERIKAAVPVVSAGTFEAYVMGSPCICEVLTDGLSFTEEAGILSLVAPRAIKMCNHSQDDIKAFNPREMLRSYKRALPLFTLLGTKDNIAYDTFALTHGYWPDDRRSMLGWFNFYLKGGYSPSPLKETSFDTLPAERLMVFSKAQRDSTVMSTAAYCIKKGKELRAVYINTKKIDARSKRNELRAMLRANEPSVLKKVKDHGEVNGWKLLALETWDRNTIPILFKAASGNTKEISIICDAAGKHHLSARLIDSLIHAGSGIVVVDLSGTGETASPLLNSNDSIGRLRTLFKSDLWLGKTPMGEWVKELNVVVGFIRSEYKATPVHFYGTKEAGLAGLFLAAINRNIASLELTNTPLSYLFDNREGIEYFSSCVNIQGLLNWGDISLAVALSGCTVHFIDPVTMSGRLLNEEERKTYNSEIERMKTIITTEPGHSKLK